MNGVRNWGRKWMITKTLNTTNEMTHLMLDGGKLSIPPDEEELFIKKLAADNIKKVKNYIVELRTPIYKFLVDIDVFEESPKPYKEIREWIRIVLSVMREFYINYEKTTFSLCKTKVDLLTTVVCTTEPKMGAQKYGKTYSKVGVHIIFPWLRVNTDIALKLRSAFIQYFYNNVKDRLEGQNEWEDVFDHTVYTQNGLRMVGCAKIDRCSVCKPPFKFVKGKPLVCPNGECNGVGKVDVGRVYKITDVLSGSGKERLDVLDELQHDEILAMKITSIRMLTETDPEPIVLPDWYDEKVLEKAKSKGVDNRTRSVTVPRTTITSLDKQQLELDTGYDTGDDTEILQRARINSSDSRRETIEAWFRDEEYIEWFLIPDVYRNAIIEDVLLIIPSGSPRYYVIRTNSRYCQNIEREHTSNGIYFVLNLTGLYQKCYCRCNTTEGRLSGLRCMDYHSKGVRVPDRLKEVLFPYTDELKVSSQMFFKEGAGQFLGMSMEDKIRSRLRQTTFKKPKK